MIFFCKFKRIQYFIVPQNKYIIIYRKNIISAGTYSANEKPVMSGTLGIERNINLSEPNSVVNSNTDSPCSTSRLQNVYQVPAKVIALNQMSISLCSSAESPKKSWVWQYAERRGDKAYCNLCQVYEKNELSCRGGTTGALGRHLKHMHNVSGSSMTIKTETVRYISIALKFCFTI